MAVPQVIWTDHKYRLVLMQGDTPAANTYRLEVKVGDLDAMGKSHYTPAELTWQLFTTILQSVQAWTPVVLTLDEMY